MDLPLALLASNGCPAGCQLLIGATAFLASDCASDTLALAVPLGAEVVPPQAASSRQLQTANVFNPLTVFILDLPYYWLMLAPGWWSAAAAYTLNRRRVAKREMATASTSDAP